MNRPSIRQHSKSASTTPQRRTLAIAAPLILLAAGICGCGGTKVSGHAPTGGPSPPTVRTPGAASTRPAGRCNPLTATIACSTRHISLKSPTGTSATGVAEVLQKGTATAIAIVAKGVPANTSHNAYAVWLYNSASDAVRLGFVNPGVGKNGRLATAGSLPVNATRYKKLVVTLETQPNPRTPGPIVLEALFAG